MFAVRPGGVAARLARGATALSLTVLAALAGQIPAAQAAPALDCSAVYAVQGASPHNLWSVDTGSAALTRVGDFQAAAATGKQLNGLGISEDGRHAYTVQPDAGTGVTTTSIYLHNRDSGSSTRLGAGASATRLTHGAVNPATGHYYYGGFDSQSRTLKVYGFNTATNTSMGLVAEGSVPAPAGEAGNGDWTFDRLGRLYVVVGKVGENRVSVVDEQLPTSRGTVTISGEEMTQILDTTAGINGIAFAGSGYLYLGSTSTLYQVNPGSGKVVGTRAMSTSGSVDLASCASPTTITVQGSFPHGRVDPSDQTTVSVTGGGVTSNNTGTTSGSEYGAQVGASEAAGPVFGLAGESYTVTQSGPGTSAPEYTTAWSCVDQNGGVEIDSGSGTTGTFTMPDAGARGVAALCTFTNAAQKPAIHLDTHVVDEPGDRAGSTVTFRHVVTNTGTTPVTVTVADPVAGPVTCPTTPVDQGGTVTCTAAPYTLSQADVDAGKVGGKAVATATPTTEGLPTATADDPDTVSIMRTSTLSLVQHHTVVDTDRNGLLDSGDHIAATYDVTNTGNTTLAQLRVDSSLGDVTCPVTTLEPGQQVSCATAAPYAVTADDEAAERVLVEGTARAVSPTGMAGSPGQLRELAATAALAQLSLVVDSENTDVNGSGITDAGDRVAYTYTVANTGNVTVSGAEVTSTRVGTVACEQPLLAPGESTLCRPSSSYRVTADDEEAGSVRDEATARGDLPDDTPVSSFAATTTEVTAPAPRLTLTGSTPEVVDVNGSGFTDAGDTVRYRYTVTNTGNVPVSDVTVVGSRAGAVTCASTTLQVEEATVCLADEPYVITGTDERAGGVTDTVHAEGRDPDAGPVASRAVSTSVDVQLPDPAIDLVLRADHTDPDGDGEVDAGEQVRFTYLVTNTGNRKLTGVSVATTLGAPVTCHPTVLAPEESAECGTGAPVVVTNADVDAGGLRQTARATGTARLPGGVDGTVTSPERGSQLTADAHTSLELAVTGDLADRDGDGRADAGERIRYTFTVTNTGSTTVRGLTVDAPRLRAAGVEVACAADTLAAGESTTCTADYVITAADALLERVELIATAGGCGVGGCAVATVSSADDTVVTEVDTVLDTVIDTGVMAEPELELPVPLAEHSHGGLPDTGGPAGSLLAAGLLSLLGGAGALLAARRRATR